MVPGTQDCTDEGRGSTFIEMTIKYCKRGHPNPERNKHGACILCCRITAKEKYLRNRKRLIKGIIDRQKKNPESRRDHQRAWRLGVPVEEVRLAIARSGLKCESCGLPLSHRTACVDHCYTTGKIRGVLCRFCNALDGMLNKQSHRVELLRQYLAMARVRLGDQDHEFLW